MNIFGKNLETEVAIVAEIGVNHEGSVDSASRLLSLAAESGAHAVKFQSYNPKRYISSSDPERLRRVTEFQLSKKDHYRLASEAEKLGIPFFSTPVTEDMVSILDELCPVFKIASGDITFEPVIRAAASTGKKIILSTGCSSTNEIDQAIGWISDEVGIQKLPEHVILMQCVSAYPTPCDEANVLSIPFLSEKYGFVVGYSNHVVGPEACFAAVALGARLLEVHFTDQKSGRSFRDHSISFEPQELSSLVLSVEKIRSSLGKFEKTLQKSEAGNAKLIRKGIVAAQDLPKGTILSQNDLMFARPATEFSSEMIDDVLGRRLVNAVSSGQMIQRENLIDD